MSDISHVTLLWAQATPTRIEGPGLPLEPGNGLLSHQHAMISQYQEIAPWPLMGCVDLLLGTNYQAWMATNRSDPLVRAINHIEWGDYQLEEAGHSELVVHTMRRIQSAITGRYLQDRRGEEEIQRGRLQKLDLKEFVMWAVGLNQGYEFDPEVLSRLGLRSTAIPENDGKPCEVRRGQPGVLASENELPPPEHTEDFRFVIWEENLIPFRTRNCGPRPGATCCQCRR